MSSIYRRKPLKSIEDKVIQLFLKRDRHLLIGEIAIYLNVHLEQVEIILEQMEMRGILRSITTEERKSKDIHDLTIAYVLLGCHKQTDNLT